MTVRRKGESYTPGSLQREREAADQVQVGCLVVLLLGMCAASTAGGAGMQNLLSGGSSSVQKFGISREVLDKGVTAGRISGERFAVRGDNYEVEFPFAPRARYVEVIDTSTGKRAGPQICRYLAQPGCSPEAFIQTR